MEYLTLNNGVKMPAIGLGVWQVTDGEEVKNAVLHALKSGYRLIDTAAIYKNEVGVGEGIRESGIPREEIFVTSKVWNDDQGYDETLQAFQASLDRLGLDYLDMYLVHWPCAKNGKFLDTYRALETLYKQGKVRAIGVSNFHIHHLKELLAVCEVVPVVNQVECHPYLSQKPLRDFCSEHNILVEAWSPIMRGGAALSDETIVALAKKYEKTPVQVILRWHIQSGIHPIPKSVTPSRIEENFNVFDFTLTAEEMAAMDALNKDERIGPDPDFFPEEN
ncbi:MAG: aldo/keto reductase [Bacillaceae bacterium]